ncbi:hypothetical protein KP509_03G011000, partial [Ceratopteris richardii]
RGQGVLLFLLLHIVSLLVASASDTKHHVRDTNSSTVYEVLEKYGFPEGLLPSTVTSYELDEDNGAFSVYLESTCTIQISNRYPIKYKSTITGYITSGEISSLKGVTVKAYLIWWTINSITVSGENLVFKVGPITRSYAISNFDENLGCISSIANILCPRSLKFRINL